MRAGSLATKFHHRMRGPIGSEIIITVVRQGTPEPFDVSIIRDTIKLTAVKGRVVGAHLLAPHAGEMVHELALAVHQGVRLDELADVFSSLFLRGLLLRPSDHRVVLVEPLLFPSELRWCVAEALLHRLHLVQIGRRRGITVLEQHPHAPFAFAQQQHARGAARHGAGLCGRHGRRAAGARREGEGGRVGDPALL